MEPRIAHMKYKDVIEKDKRGYSAVQIGFGKTKQSKLTKQMNVGYT